MHDDAVAVDDHLGFLAAERGELRHYAADDRARRTVEALAEQLSGDLS